mgnify:FL=1
MNFNSKILFLFFCSIITAQISFAQSNDYELIMGEIIQISNDYSGVLNTRQTWEVSYEGCTVTDQYFFDDELTLIVKIDLKNMDAVKVEERFANSISIYPKDKSADYIEATRYENGQAEKITDGVYYNLMLMPDMREKVREMMEQAILICQEK